MSSLLALDGAEIHVIPGDPFFDRLTNYIFLPDCPELTNGVGSLSPELIAWCAENAPKAQWTYRRGTGFHGQTVTKVLFTFETEQELLHFKMRWHN